jgi:anti-sigma B factor antagonist
MELTVASRNKSNERGGQDALWQGAMENGSFRVIERGDAQSVVVETDVDLTNFAELEATIERAAAQPRPIVVDLAACTYLDSSGLGVLIRRYNALGDQLRIVLPENGSARRVFDITGLTEALPAFETFDEAVTAEAGAAPQASQP